MIKKEQSMVLVLGFLSFSATFLSAAAFDESEEKGGLPSTPATIRAPRKESEKGMRLTVVRREVRSEEEIEVRRLIQDYSKEDPSFSAKENSKKIRALLKKISVQNPKRLQDIIEQTMMKGYNIFHIAAAKNHKKLVVALLKYYPGILNSKTLSWNTALHLAYRYGAKKVVAFLEAQPDINKEIKNIDGLIASQMLEEKDKPLNEAEGFSIKKDRAKQNEK